MKKIFQRLLFAISSLVLGLLLVQVILFAFGPVSLVLYLDHPIIWAFAAGCFVVGAIKGNEFVWYLRKQLEDWDIHNLFKIKR